MGSHTHVYELAHAENNPEYALENLVFGAAECSVSPECRALAMACITSHPNKLNRLHKTKRI